MPRYYGGEGRNYDRDRTPASTHRKSMDLPTGVFRCDRCDRVMPERFLVEQDGHDLCRPLCADRTSQTDQQLQLAEQLARADSYEPNELPPSNAFSGAVTITSTPTWPVRIVDGGANVALSFVGVGFTSGMAISYSDAGITDNTAPVITSTTLALDLVSSGVTPGKYNITIAGSTYHRVLEIV